MIIQYMVPLVFQGNMRTMVMSYFRHPLILFMCLCLQVRLTKNLRGGLMFLDDHMSSSRRNKKHLKVTFAKFVAAAAAEEEGS